MSMRYQAGIVLPGYNALKVANAPTIGTATVASGTTVSVTFTAPACTGGGAISSYTAFACCGVKLVSGASSPLVVTGLTTSQAYTFKVIATNAYGPSYPSASSNSATPPAAGQQAYTTAGSYSWVAPSGVTSVSVVTVGGGGGWNNYYSNTGGSGGGLRYRNNYTVIPGNSYTVNVGAAGSTGNALGVNTRGGSSYFINTCTVYAQGGVSQDQSNPCTPACGYFPGGTGSAIGGSIGGGNGGASSRGSNSSGGGGGGGAGGYSGNGGAGGGKQYSKTATAGSGGGGGGGAGAGTNYCGSCGTGGSAAPGLGGGVGLLGQGSNGASGGANGSNASYPTLPGSGGSGVAGSGGCGKLYGGGGTPGTNYSGGQAGGNGAVRIIWPGTTRSFPSTCTGNL